MCMESNLFFPVSVLGNVADAKLMMVDGGFSFYAIGTHSEELSIYQRKDMVD